ncbi:MAG: sterol-binding protein [Frankiales bacterium]|nr:sterol-binding protein [Frankiales bacterium]
MATLEAVEQAVHDLLERLAEVDPDVRRRYAVERTVACRVRDLDIVFLAAFDDDGAIRDLTTAERGDGQVKLSASSDDLIALIEGRLSVPTAWATGKLRIDASMLDLLKLRSLL